MHNECFNDDFETLQVAEAPSDSSGKGLTRDHKISHCIHYGLIPWEKENGEKFSLK